MFNSEAYISEAINSIVNQSYTNWELLLIDDCSTDKTLEIVRPFLKSYSNIIIIKNEKNLGSAMTRNKGIEASNGDYIAFLDGDDIWKPNKLEKQLVFMETNNCDVCFSSYDLINEKSEPLNKTIKALPVLTYKKLLRSNYVGNLTGIYHARILGKITSFNLLKRQDWLIWLAAIKKSGKPAKGIQKSLAYYRVRETSLSFSKFNLIKYNYWVYRKGLGFSAIRSVYNMLLFLFEHFFIKSKQTVTTNKI